jgi:hypothetical protein
MSKLIFITILVLALIPSSVLSKKTTGSKPFPVYENGGKPDLVVDPQRFVAKMEIVDGLFNEGSCAIEEGAVGGTGYRRLLRFNVVVMNSGDGDLVVGDHSDPNNPYAGSFQFAACQGHYEIRGFSNDELLNNSRTVVVAEHKQGFWFDDSLKSRGRKTVRQWIDITGVPEGDYIVRVTVNAAGTFDEGENRYTNSVETSIHVPNPRKKVTIDNSPEAFEK